MVVVLPSFSSELIIILIIIIIIVVIITITTTILPADLSRIAKVQNRLEPNSEGPSLSAVCPAWGRAPPE